MRDKFVGISSHINAPTWPSSRTFAKIQYPIAHLNTPSGTHNTIPCKRLSNALKNRYNIRLPYDSYRLPRLGWTGILFCRAKDQRDWHSKSLRCERLKYCRARHKRFYGPCGHCHYDRTSYRLLDDEPWLSDFAYRTNIGLSPIFVSAALCMTIAFASAGYQAIRAALLRPSESLRNV